MAQFNMRDFKKQASFFLRERLKDARLALTDVSRIQLIVGSNGWACRLTEEATNEDPWGPETRTMAMLADAAFELEEYDRIVKVIQNRLEGGMQRPWRQLYKTLVVLDYLLTHGPASMGKEFQGDIFLIEELSQFNFTDSEGIDKGSMVRKVADRLLELLNDPELWKEERSRARKLSFGIRGFGSSVNQVPADDAVEVGQDVIRMANDKGPSISSQSKEVGSANAIVQQNVSMKPFKKSLSSLGSLRERLPQLSRQAAALKDETSDSEEASMGLLDGVDEGEGPSQQGGLGGAELVHRLVTC